MRFLAYSRRTLFGAVLTLALALFVAFQLMPSASVGANIPGPSVVVVVPSISAMQGLGAGAGQYPNVMVTGSQGGLFTWNGAGSATTDGCTHFTANSVSPGRYERLVTGSKSTVELSWCDTLAHADSVAASTAKTLEIDIPVILTGNTFLGSRRVVGAELISLSSFTLSVQGFFDPAPYQIFNVADQPNITLTRPPLSITPELFGATGRGGTHDDAAPLNASMALVASGMGGTLVLRPNRTYAEGSQVTLGLNQNSEAYQAVHLIGFGSSLQPMSGLAISALQSVGCCSAEIPVIEGIFFDLNHDSSATAGLSTGAPHSQTHLRIINNVITCTPSAPGILFTNANPGDENFGTFWPLVLGNIIGNKGGSQTCVSGIDSQGTTNGANIAFNNIAGTTTGELITFAPGQTLMPNGFFTGMNTFEEAPTVISVANPNSGVGISSFMSLSDQIDSGATTAFSFTGTISAPLLPSSIMFPRDLSYGSVVNTTGQILNYCTFETSAFLPPCTLVSGSGFSFTTGNNRFVVNGLDMSNPGAGNGFWINSNVINNGN